MCRPPYEDGIAAGGGRVMASNQLARWFGVAILGLNALAMMFLLPAYPAVGATQATPPPPPIAVAGPGLSGRFSHP